MQYSDATYSPTISAVPVSTREVYTRQPYQLNSQPAYVSVHSFSFNTALDCTFVLLEVYLRLKYACTKIFSTFQEGKKWKTRFSHALDEPHTRIQSIKMSVDFGFTEEERVIAKLHLTHALRLAIDNFEQDHYAVKNADGCDFIYIFNYAANWLREQLPGGRFTGSAQHPRSTSVHRAGPTNDEVVHSPHD
ncbi:unnamed protein product [Trichogramma brassicae]|uniref:Uncharacterized protein n=1 Tax=Trichogramma brassicae TaxID=86971 RepID=A0A6H5IL74_9HYME|nr:unnamed protein product [Trichogramma brassicae]